jgi:hypothetical protein
MLRSAATPNRTEVQSSPSMKQTTIRQLLPTLTESVRFGCALAVTKTLAEINPPRSLV